MNKESVGMSPTKTPTISGSCTIATLIKEATEFLHLRGDYCEREVSYISCTWHQFQVYCESRGFKSYLPEHRENYINSLHTDTAPLKAATIKRKHSYLKMLELYSQSENWEKGALNVKPKLSDEFSCFVTSQEEFLTKRRYSEFSRKTAREQTIGILSFFQKQGVYTFSDVVCDNISAYILTLKGHAKSTIHGELSRIRQLLRNAYLLEYTKTDLSVCVPSYRLGHPQSNVKIWQSNELNQVLETVDRSNPKGLRDAAYITIASELGMRSKDIADLKLSDLDWESCSISFAQSKTGKANSLPISEKIGRAIIEYLRVRPNTDCEYLFVSMNPPYRKMGSFNSSFGRYVHRSGVAIPPNAHHHLHSLRATVATRLLEEGIPVDDIVSFLGHSDRDSLHNYIRMDIEHLRNCALSFEDGEFV